jgi:hypothetical protein
MVLELGRSTITALWLGRRRTLRKHELPPADPARRTALPLAVKTPNLDSGHRQPRDAETALRNI